ncbi:cell wall-binding repeat-containing protein [Candidatus Poriferisodalis sp.]|uniref:cell wall-binding repeat-containing protein n=1 Tax=Candidatus Poriferisodalis sp. TaxID=3101277 RepID=UPI003B525EDE
MTVGVTASPLGAAEDTAVETALAKVNVVRYGGADRFETSVLTTKAFSDFKGDLIVSVMMVSGFKWHDAVVTAPFDTPVILTRRNAVPPKTMEYLRRFTSPSNGAPFVTLISTNAISPAVDDQLAKAGMEVFRIDGSDQFLTSVAVAERLGGLSQFRGVRTVILASGQVFADALVAGRLASYDHLPILLNPPHALHSKIREFLSSYDVEQVILMGGAAALSQDVEDSIRELDIRTLRVAGQTRFETAVEVARITGLNSCHIHGGSLAVGLTRAWVPYDAFSATPMLARYGAPLLLTAPDELPPATMAYLDEARAAQAKCGDEPLMLIVIGGEAAVSQEAIDAYLQRGEEIVTTDE